jgi:hypothetical protein
MGVWAHTYIYGENCPGRIVYNTCILNGEIRHATEYDLRFITVFQVRPSRTGFIVIPSV